ncbi:MAG: hypothetical protein NT004_08340 [Bacteroidetes bacterium]|nr:hypothetical protein [Bacteroidota bacterium]
MNSILLSLWSLPLLSVNLNILAYIDPGTGSIILQALVASVVGAAIAVKLFWHRILKFFGLRKGVSADPSEKQGENKK